MRYSRSKMQFLLRRQPFPHLEKHTDQMSALTRHVSVSIARSRGFWCIISMTLPRLLRTQSNCYKRKSILFGLKSSRSERTSLFTEENTTTCRPRRRWNRRRRRRPITAVVRALRAFIAQCTRRLRSVMRILTARD